MANFLTYDFKKKISYLELSKFEKIKKLKKSGRAPRAGRETKCKG